MPRHLDEPKCPKCGWSVVVWLGGVKQWWCQHCGLKFVPAAPLTINVPIVEVERPAQVKEISAQQMWGEERGDE